MNETPETTNAPDAPETPPDKQNPTPTAQETASAMRAVLAIPARRHNSDGWAGRILEHAPGPAETVRALREILGKRHKGRHRAADAITELIFDHPAGWERLGPDPAATGAKRTRETPLGTCRCHEPDGTPRPALLRAQHQALIKAEWNRPMPGEVPGALEPADDGTPWLITRSSTFPNRVHHVFVLHEDTIDILACDRGADRKAHRDRYVHGFTSIARVHATRPVDWDVIAPKLDADSAEMRARPRTDWSRIDAAKGLARAAKELEGVPAHADLLLYLLGKETDARSKPTAEAALAEAGGVHGADLPALLLRAPRAEQLRLLRQAAHLMDPAENRAPQSA